MHRKNHDRPALFDKKHVEGPPPPPPAAKLPHRKTAPARCADGCGAPQANYGPRRTAGGPGGPPGGCQCAAIWRNLVFAERHLFGAGKSFSLALSAQRVQCTSLACTSSGASKATFVFKSPPILPSGGFRPGDLYMETPFEGRLDVQARLVQGNPGGCGRGLGKEGKFVRGGGTSPLILLHRISSHPSFRA